MREGCRRLARALILLLFCRGLGSDCSMGAAVASEGPPSIGRRGAKPPSNLPSKPEDAQVGPMDSDYCMLEDAEIREASSKLEANTLNDRRIRVKRVAAEEEAAAAAAAAAAAEHSESVPKSGLREASEATRDSLKFAEKSRDSSLIGYDDVGKYADQEISRIYDDFEAKDLVKRGVLLADDYEEVNELDELDAKESAARVRANDDPGSLEESGGANWQDSPAERELARKDDESKLFQEAAAGEADLEGKASKSIRTKHQDWRRSAGLGADRAELEGAADQKSLRAGTRQYEVELEEARAGNNRGGGLLGLSGVLEVADANPSEEDDARLEDDAPSNSDTIKRNAELYNEYEKRAEAEIQRKIDMIKKDIKREIEQNQRLREIEENNAKFDELRIQDENAEENDSQGTNMEKVRKRQTVKRQSKPIGPTHESEKLDKRPKAKRKSKPAIKRDLDSRKSIVGKRSALPLKKREYARQVILVENGAETRKKRKKRKQKKKKKKRKKRASDLSRQSSLLEESAAASSSGAAHRAETEADGASPLAWKSRQVSLRENTRETNQRLAPDYNGAFGGLQADPDPRASLARYKRIKRTLRVPT